MKNGLTLFSFLISFTIFSQESGFVQHHYCRDLFYVVEYVPCNLPVVGASILIKRDDGERVHLKTDSLGRAQVCECTKPGFFVDGYVYETEITVSENQVEKDCVSTESPMRATRAIRHIQVEKDCPAEVKPVKIDLTIHYLDDEGMPMKGVKGHLMRDDSMRVDFVTDSLGSYEIRNGAHNGFMAPDHKYTLEMEGKMHRYLGTEDAFQTTGIKTNTRLIRELRMLAVCSLGRPVGMTFEENILAMNEANIAELQWWYDTFVENQTMVIAILGVYDDEKEIKMAWKRAEFIRNKLIEMGIEPERLSLEVIGRVYLTDPSDEYTRFYQREDVVDVTLQIVSFDFKSQK
jgi:hypothetical protein